MSNDSQCDCSESENSGKEIPCERYIVGIGASAGGLQALEDFFDAVPDDLHATYVVVQHLSPDYESHMEELLGRRTKLPIRRVEHEMALESDHIYLIPPAKTLIVSDGKFLLTEKDRSALSFPIDTFLRSVAVEARKSSIGVILSGTGSDGSRGIIDISEAGGLVLCQSAESSKFDGMPVSAMETGVVDLILEPFAMAGAIQQYVEKNLSPDSLPENLPPELPANTLDRIFDALHKSYGIDFAQYKPNTITRRMQRRIDARADGDLEAYADIIEAEPTEVRTLYQDLLIGVTKFYRDEDAFALIKKRSFRQS